jgi:hypothetical protein
MQTGCKLHEPRVILAEPATLYLGHRRGADDHIIVGQLIGARQTHHASRKSFAASLAHRSARSKRADVPLHHPADPIVAKHNVFQRAFTFYRSCRRARRGAHQWYRLLLRVTRAM